MQNETQKEIAGIQSATSRQNTKDQVYAQNEMLAYQQKESTARVDKQASHLDRKSGSAGMPRPISYAVFCLKKKSGGIHSRVLPFGAGTAVRSIDGIADNHKHRRA